MFVCIITPWSENYWAVQGIHNTSDDACTQTDSRWLIASFPASRAPAFITCSDNSWEVWEAGNEARWFIPTC